MLTSPSELYRVAPLSCYSYYNPKESVSNVEEAPSPLKGQKVFVFTSSDLFGFPAQWREAEVVKQDIKQVYVEIPLQEEDLAFFPVNYTLNFIERTRLWFHLESPFILNEKMEPFFCINCDEEVKVDGASSAPPRPPFKKRKAPEVESYYPPALICLLIRFAVTVLDHKLLDQ